MDVHQSLPQSGILGKGPRRVFQQLLAGLFDFRFRWLVLAGGLLRRFQGGIWVGGVEQSRGEGVKGYPPGFGLDGLAVPGIQMPVEPSKATRQRG